MKSNSNYDGDNESDGKHFLMKRIPSFLKESLGLTNTDFKVLAWVPVLYQGWELDEWAVLIQTSNHNKILLDTDHGALNQVQNPKEFLTDQINFYQAFIEKSNAALAEIERN